MIMVFNIILVTIICLVLHQRQNHKIIRRVVYSETINDVQSTSKQS